jgi:SAM-dependent methyltransferase
VQKGYEKKYHEIETDHFWFRARREFIIKLLAGTNKEAKILDIGCSSGILLKELESNSFNAQYLYGLDISPEAIRNCKNNGIENAYVMDGHTPSFGHQFDIIIASDNLEHLKDDHLALKNWYEALKPGGKLYVFVPAYMFLWSHHDVANMHYRRYTKKELSQKLSDVGFQIERKSYWNVSLFLPLYFKRKLSSFMKYKDEKIHGDIDDIPKINKTLLALLRAENHFIKRINVPMGVSVFCVASKTPA